MRALVAVYGQVRANLLKHAQGWPEAGALDAVIAAGQPAYGMAAVGDGKTSAGAEAIIRAADKTDPRPLWITLWGGANTLAQALWQVRATRSPAEVEKFVGRLRVSSISDQDDAGPWIRREFPGLFYIVNPSRPDSGNYASATWTGISGDVYYRNCAGADGSTVTNEWLEENIRAKGPLGKHYRGSRSSWKATRRPFSASPTTVSAATAIRVGAAGADATSGAAVRRSPGNLDAGRRHVRACHLGGRGHRNRWPDLRVGPGNRLALAHRLSARLCRSDGLDDQAVRRGQSNPQLVVNGAAGTVPIVIDVKVGEPVTLDASGSRDPDGHQLSTDVPLPGGRLRARCQSGCGHHRAR